MRDLRATRMVLAIIRAAKWLTYYLRYSATLSNHYVAPHSHAKIMKQAHTIEKGLSFGQIRPHFGADKRAHLLEEMHLSKTAGDNAAACTVGASVLDAYVGWHRASGQDGSDIAELEQVVARFNAGGGAGGTVPYRRDYTPEQTAAYDAMVRERRSVRNFRTDPVPLELLHEAIRVANYSPSVCNRQSWAVSIVQDPAKVRTVLGLQNGNRGFNDTIGNVLVVHANVQGFLDEYEMFEPFVDGGLFSNALVNALNARNIGSCCLNLCSSHHKVMELAAALDLRPGLFPIMMIACGYVAEDCRVAMSKRLEPMVFVN
ncbi:nitroreductase family protein [Xanthobacter autotrophicus DSM 431]|uniref:nitroreductase family protein n=1 Tax=Xanthobacter nonsaccharivorans TaxID=3119912 RepID=UPI00372BD35A